MADAAQLRVEILADASKARSELAGVEGSVGKLSGAVKGIAVGVAAGFAVNQIVDFGMAAVTAADESAKVMAKTEAVIKATGGAAHLTATQVSDLAGALSEKTAVDDEAIQTGANMLLTFKNVRNEAGKGADVFNRATAAAVDLSSAGFGSIESASVMLGKALQDPEKGMTALAKSGVTFTEQQKSQVESMVEANDMLGAQKLILKEVEGQVGGTAAASATAMDRIKLAAGNAMEKIGAALLPLVDTLLPIFTDLIEQILPVLMPVVVMLVEMAGAVLKQLVPALMPLLAQLAVMAGELLVSLADVLIALVPTIVAMVPPLVQLLMAITPLVPLVAKLLIQLGPLITIAATLAGTVVTLAAALIGPLLSAIEKILKPLEKLGDLTKSAGKLLGGLNPFAASAGGAAYAGGLILAPAGYGATRGGSLRQSITINVQSPLGADPYRMGSQIVAAIRRYEGRNGRYSAPEGPAAGYTR